MSESLVSFENETRGRECIKPTVRMALDEIVNVRGCTGKWSWPGLRHYPRIYLYEPQIRTEILNHDNLSLGSTLKPEMAEEEEVRMFPLLVRLRE
jgi:hypothetical protein